jgi:hypothetical protein
MLVSGFILGAVLGAAGGGLQALVLRRAALGVGAWTAWSTAAFAIAFSFFAGSTHLLDAGGGLAGELANQVLAFLTEVIAAVVMVQAVRGLRDPVLSRAGQHFS